jgi:hypothetical protein
MSKKSMDFVAAMRSVEEREGVQCHLRPAPATAASPVTAPAERIVQRSRIGKVSIGVWVNPAVRKQLAQLALDTDKDQGDLVPEGLNLLFERYEKPPIAKVG